MNRPYNVQIVVDNLQGTIGKSTMQKILDHFADQGSLTRKEFGKQKLYWRNQVRSKFTWLISNRKTLKSLDPMNLQKSTRKVLLMKTSLRKSKKNVKNSLPNSKLLLLFLVTKLQMKLSAKSLPRYVKLESLFIDNNRTKI